MTLCYQMMVNIIFFLPIKYVLINVCALFFKHNAIAHLIFDSIEST